MAKRPVKKKQSDHQQLACNVLDAIASDAEPAKPADQPEKNPAAVALGRLGGLKNGKARAGCHCWLAQQCEVGTSVHPLNKPEETSGTA